MSAKWRPAVHSPADPYDPPRMCGERGCAHRCHTLPLGVDPMQGSAKAYDDDERRAIAEEAAK